MRNTKVSKRYATALFSLAQEMNKLEEVSADMQLVSSVCAASKELSILLASPIVNEQKKLAVINDIFGAKVDELSSKYLELILKKGREAILVEITEQFVVLYKEYMGIVSLIIKTAVSLEDKERNRIKELIKNATQANEVELIEQVDPRLIGGVVMAWDDNQIDMSLQRKLKELKRDFDSNVFLKGL
ncbi:MAG: ATP synthase F1 subunit delta [Bacteroidales bacterium]|nr:ATP synthase F1 subunit delta [Bacteroidales bacterium]